MVGLIRKQSRPEGQKENRSPWGRLFHALRRILTVALLVAAGLVLVLTVAFLFAPPRSALLGWGVRFADDALPGSLTAGGTSWPTLGHLVLSDVLWVSGSAGAPGDTLADVAVLDLSLDLGGLKSREGKIESLVLDIRRVDVPAITLATAGMAGGALPDSTDSLPAAKPGEFPFLNPGGLPGFPSAVLDQLELEIDRARLAPGMSIRDLVLSGRADVGGGRPAAAVVDHAEVHLLTAVGDSVEARVWEVDLDHLGFGLQLEGSVDESGVWAMGAAALDSLTLEIAPVVNPDLPEIWSFAEPVTLKASGNIARTGSNYSGHLECDFNLPGSARFHPWLPEDFPHEEFKTVAGHLLLSGYFEDPVAKADLRLDLGSSTWLEKGVIAGTAEADIEA